MVSSIVQHTILGVIPARFASTRFPGKSLAFIAGRPMIQHVYERARQAESLTHVVIATDDRRIFEAAEGFGAPVRLTSPDHPSGTDRVAEVAAAEIADLVVNIQGDEPLIEPAAIDAAVRGILEAPGVPMSTLKRRIEDPRELSDPNVVKVVTDGSGNALYFSRFPVPFDRHGESEHFKHVGLYVYRSDFLLEYQRLPVGPLEKAERLEQLRALENGYSIRVVETAYESLGVDTPDDLERVSQILEAKIVTDR